MLLSNRSENFEILDHGLLGAGVPLACFADSDCCDIFRLNLGHVRSPLLSEHSSGGLQRHANE